MPSTWCIHCRGEDDLTPQYGKGFRHALRVEHRPITDLEAPMMDNVRNCFGAQPGLGRFGFVLLYRLDRRGQRYLCTNCGKAGASYRSFGDTRVEYER